MTELVAQRNWNTSQLATVSLKAATQLWFIIAMVGLAVFAYYVTVFYGGALLHGRLQTWNAVMPHGYVAGDSVGNIAVGIHLLLAVFITIGGMLQLLPGLRRIAPRFHRWNGRVYLLAVCVTSIAGLYMVWVRHGVGGFVQHLGITLDAVLILFTAAMSLRYAVKREIATHQRWALRLFIVSNAVWFYRVGLMFSMVVNHGPFGFDPDSFRGPFLDFISFADSLLPLAVLELFLRARQSSNPNAKLAMALILFVLTLAMATGIAAASMGMWLPRLR